MTNSYAELLHYLASAIYQRGHMKASTRNHIGTLTMAMPLENFSQCWGAYPYISDSSDLEFSSESAACSIESTPAAMFRNTLNYVVTSANSTMSSFIGNPLQESTSSPPMASNVVLPKLRNGTELSFSSTLQKRSSMETMREMIFRIAMMQPIHIDPESVKPPKRKNVKISKDPQSVAARHRRERISERIRILQRLVPGGTKMDTASMLDEAAHYLKFLKKQVQTLEQAANNRPLNSGIPMTMATAATSYSNLMKSCQPPPPPPPPPPHVVGSMQLLS